MSKFVEKVKDEVAYSASLFLEPGVLFPLLAIVLVLLAAAVFG